ncbi:hypothetical protein AD998_06005 [bacterium 336/3]|nr:hypothetical protein AD998_06005 [bacterium 336/3]
MKKILFISVYLLLCNLALAQNVTPLYLIYQENNSNQYKNVNAHWNYEDKSLDEDIFGFMRIPCDNVPLTVATINKRNYIEINQSQLASYGVKTDEQVLEMLRPKSHSEEIKFFMDLEREQKLFVVEILPNNKARIYQVRNITSR